MEKELESEQQPIIEPPSRNPPFPRSLHYKQSEKA